MQRLMKDQNENPIPGGYSEHRHLSSGGEATHGKGYIETLSELSADYGGMVRAAIEMEILVQNNYSGCK